tara:strand:+ start:500 stop:928 length:429 start_codon:yes stop_codon:yes gene_type:complete
MLNYKGGFMDININAASGMVIVNGKIITGEDNFNNKDVVIKAFVDGKEVSIDQARKISIEVTGDVKKISTGSGSVSANNVGSVSTASGDVECKTVSNNVQTASGDVDCEDVHGDVTTMSGDVAAKIINGDVKSMSGDIRCKR